MINFHKIESSDLESTMIEKLNQNFQQIATAGGGPMGRFGYQGFPGLPAKDGEDGNKGLRGEEGTGFIVFTSAEAAENPPTLTPEEAFIAGYKAGDVWFNSSTNVYYTLVESPSPAWETKTVSYTVSDLIFKKSTPTGVGLVEHAFFDNSYFGSNDPTAPNDDLVFNTTTAISSYQIKSTETVDAIYGLTNFGLPVNGAWQRNQFKMNFDQIHNPSQVISNASTGLYGGSVDTEDFTPIIYLGEYLKTTDTLANFGLLSYTEKGALGTPKQVFSIQGHVSLTSEFYFAGAKVWSDGDYLSSFRSGIGESNKNFGTVLADTSTTSSTSTWFGLLNYSNPISPSPFDSLVRTAGLKVVKGTGNSAYIDIYGSNDLTAGSSNFGMRVGTGGTVRIGDPISFSSPGGALYVTGGSYFKSDEFKIYDQSNVLRFELNVNDFIFYDNNGVSRFTLENDDEFWMLSEQTLSVSTTGAFNIGNKSVGYLAFDRNDIQAFTGAGNATSLNIQNKGGKLFIGTSSTYLGDFFSYANDVSFLYRDDFLIGTSVYSDLFRMKSDGESHFNASQDIIADSVGALNIGENLDVHLSFSRDQIQVFNGSGYASDLFISPLGGNISIGGTDLKTGSLPISYFDIRYRNNIRFWYNSGSGSSIQTFDIDTGGNTRFGASSDKNIYCELNRNLYGSLYVNTIQAFDNGTPDSLYINYDGGNVRIGDSSDLISLRSGGGGGGVIIHSYNYTPLTISVSYGTDALVVYDQTIGTYFRVRNGGRIYGRYISTSSATGYDLQWDLSTNGEFVRVSSDEREKTAITPMPSILSQVNQLNVVDFLDKKTKKPSFGLVAQEAEKIIPQLVIVPEDEDELWGVAYSRSGIIAIKAIQEQQEIIDSLEERIKKLEELINSK